MLKKITAGTGVVGTGSMLPQNPKLQPGVVSPPPNPQPTTPGSELFPDPTPEEIQQKNLLIQQIVETNVIWDELPESGKIYMREAFGAKFNGSRDDFRGLTIPDVKCVLAYYEKVAETKKKGK